MADIRTRAIVLSRVNYGEADRILQLITPDHGKMGVIARGVRREKSKLAGGIELLAECELTLHQGKGDLALVTSSRLMTFYGNILGDYDKLQLAYFVLKDVSKYSEQLTEPELYEATRLALVSLNEKTISAQVVELWYRLQMAIILGAGINLATDENGMKLVEDATYRFETESMSFVHDPRGTFTSDHIKILRVASAQQPAVVAHISGLSELLDDCLRIARIAHE